MARPHWATAAAAPGPGMSRRDFGRALGIGLSATTLGGTLGACGNGGSGSGKVQLLYWTHQYDPAITVNEQLIEQYQQENPNVEITYDYTPHGNYEQKLFTALAGGSGPDVFWAGDWLVPQFVDTGSIAPVDFSAYDVDGADQFLALFEQGALDPFIQGDDIYTGGISERQVFSAFYHPQHMNAAGLPEDLPEDEPLTWEQIAEYAGQLVQREGGKRVRDGIQWELKVPIWVALIVESMVRQLGGEIYDADAGRPNLTSPEIKQAMGYIQDLRQKYDAIDPALYVQDNIVPAFAEDRISMNIGGPFQPSLAKSTNPDVELDITPYPVFDGGQRTTATYSWAWFVNAAADEEKRHEAWRFVNFLSSHGQLWWDEVRYPQARKGQTDEGQDLNDYRIESEPTYAVSLKDFEYARYQFRSKDYYKIASALQRAQSRVLGGENIDSVLQNAQSEAEG